MMRLVVGMLLLLFFFLFGLLGRIHDVELRRQVLEVANLQEAQVHDIGMLRRPAHDHLIRWRLGLVASLCGAHPRVAATANVDSSLSRTSRGSPTFRPALREKQTWLINAVRFWALSRFARGIVTAHELQLLFEGGRFLSQRKRVLDEADISKSRGVPRELA